MQDKRIDALLELLKGNNREQAQQVRQEAQSGLSAEQQELFRKALTDQNVAQQLLNSPQAVEVLKKLRGNGNKNGSE